MAAPSKNISKTINRAFQIFNNPSNFPKNLKYSCILLNGPKSAQLTTNQQNFWQQANKRVVVDGGFNILKNCQAKFKNSNSNSSIKSPEFIFLGDEDSYCQTQTLTESDSGLDFDLFLNSKNSSSKKSSYPKPRIIRNHDQSLTDFDKCLSDLGPELDQKIIVLTWGSITRLDHMISFFTVLNKHSNLQVEMLIHNELDSCLTYLFCLPGNKSCHKIFYHPNSCTNTSCQNSKRKRPTCGVFSLSSQSGAADSTGLAYELDSKKHKLGFDALQSTSNIARLDEITINVVKDNLLFTTVIPDS